MSQIPRSASPNTKKLSEQTQKQKRQLSFESNIVIPMNPQEISTTEQTTKSELPTENKYENVSDNGSEISDEGYRSLGLIQNGKSEKRASMLSQVSNEDAETSGKYIFHINFP